ncbi:MFS transporter [Bordetella sp. H567]|uniref:tripartite tricarboxylate transporter substrate binding protein n=1 Tax=Bordetella sp. H567 TaxID=1697043 RepID=UPI00081D1342|nr:tripartite tricarboxylate transporter substrate binding protein [Bordetella sp. H567]AOB32963.1 MFS transporter [Bordetella sp. H567]
MPDILRAWAAAAALCLAGAATAAPSYPDKPIRLIVPFPAGGTTDILARTVGQRLTMAWGQPVIIENRPGAGATIGADVVAKARPDGYTLLMAAVHHTIAATYYKQLPYDLRKDLAPVSVVAIVPNVLVVRPDLPVSNVQELIAYAKANPGKLTYASNGAGTAHNLIGEQFKSMTGTDIMHIPYKGSAPALTDLMGGRVTMMFDTVSSCLPYVKAGKLKALAVATSARSSVLPDVPTLSEAGLKGFDIASWFGVMAPAGTPRAIVDKLSAQIDKDLADPEVRKVLLPIGAEPVGGTPQAMQTRIDTEVRSYGELMKRAGMQEQ